MTQAWPTLLGSIATLVAALGGVALGDLLGGRRAKASWLREQDSARRARLLDAYAEVLQLATLSTLAIELQIAAREAEVPVRGFEGQPGLEVMPQLATSVNRAMLSGASADAAKLMRAMLKLTADTVRLA